MIHQVFEQAPDPCEEAVVRPYAYQLRGLEPRTSHPFHTYEHILRQPEVVAETLGTSVEHIHSIALQLADKAQRYILTGVGSSYHVALASSQLLGRIAGVEAEALDSYEWLTSHLVRRLSDTVVVGYSTSGRTQETLAALEHARQQGTWCLGVTCQPQSLLAELCDAVLIAAGGQGYVFDYSSRLAMTYLLALELAAVLGKASADLEAIRRSLRNLPALLQETLQRIERSCQAIGFRWRNRRAILCIATGLLHTVALETAMRFTEMTTIPAVGMSLAQYFHCSIGATDEKLAVFLFAPPGPGYERMLDLARLTQVLKVPAVAVVDESDRNMSVLVDEVIRLPHVTDTLMPFVYALPGQLVPYYAEIHRDGGNPDIRRTDQPRYARAFQIAFGWDRKQAATSR